MRADEFLCISIDWITYKFIFQTKGSDQSIKDRTIIDCYIGLAICDILEFDLEIRLRVDNLDLMIRVLFIPVFQSQSLIAACAYLCLITSVCNVL